MRQLTLAATALLAAIFLSVNTPATAAGLTGSFQAKSHAKVKRGCCRGRVCAGCAAYRYTVYPSCGRYGLYNYTTITGCPGYGYTNYRCGCACGTCSCGYGYGGCGPARGWGLSRWLY
jgi:hypothetical protein